MNKLILEKLDEIITDIKESKQYSDYIFLRDKLNKNEKVINIIKDIKELQKEIVKKEVLKQDISDLEKELSSKNELLNKIPLYIDFICVQEELNLTYQLLKQELDNYFYDLFN